MVIGHQIERLLHFEGRIFAIGNGSIISIRLRATRRQTGGPNRRDLPRNIIRQPYPPYRKSANGQHDRTHYDDRKSYSDLAASPSHKNHLAIECLPGWTIFSCKDCP